MIWWDIDHISFLPSPLPFSDPTLLPSQHTPAYFSSFQLKNFQRKHLEEQKRCASWRAGSFLIIKCTFELKWLPPTVMGCMQQKACFLRNGFNFLIYSVIKQDSWTQVSKRWTPWACRVLSGETFTLKAHLSDFISVLLLLLCFVQVILKKA